LAGLCKLLISRIQIGVRPFSLLPPGGLVLLLPGPMLDQAAQHEERPGQMARTPVSVMSLRSKITGTKKKLGLAHVQREGGAVQALAEQA